MRRFITTVHSLAQTASCRLILILFCLIQAIGRLVHIGQVASINVLSSDWYAILMLVAVVGLSATTFSCRARASYIGRLVAVYALGLWLLLAFDVLSAPISSANAFLIALIAGHEVFYRAC